MLDAQKDTFVIVFIDEVESLTSTRQHSADSHEPKDALRVCVLGCDHARCFLRKWAYRNIADWTKAVNALLTALDRLRNHSNVVIFTTSNLIKAMVGGPCFNKKPKWPSLQDLAFLDRVDIKQYVPQPSTQARYEIYRTCYLELARRNIIAPFHHIVKDDALTQTCMLPDMFEGQPSNTLESEYHSHLLDENSLPDYNSMFLNHWGEESSIVWRLWKIAERSAVSRPWITNNSILLIW